MFLHLCVILFTGGSPRQRPPSLDRNSPDRDPLDRDPPGQRPPPREIPPWQRAGGMHPTGMHSCVQELFPIPIPHKPNKTAHTQQIYAF